MRSSRNVLRSVHACCLPPVRQTGRLAICSVPIPPWVGIAGSAFSDVAWLSGFVGSLRACAFLYGDPDGERRGRGGRSRRRGRVRFCVTISALRRFPRGVRWGLRAPKPAPKSHWLSGLSSFGSRRGGVSRGEGHSKITRTCASLPPWCIIKINTLPKQGGFSRWRARTE